MTPSSSSGDAVVPVELRQLGGRVPPQDQHHLLPETIDVAYTMMMMMMMMMIMIIMTLPSSSGDAVVPVKLRQLGGRVPP
jgi:hypothetical protein